MKSLGFSSDWLASSISLDSLRRSSVSSVNNRSDLHDSRVDGTTDAVLHFKIQLGNHVEFKGSIFLQIFFG
jgi:hypothetical protein